MRLTDRLTHLTIGLMALMAVFTCPATLQAESAPGKGAFLMDGEPFVVKAAELHYPRIPREYWDHRIKMSKALGMNTVCMYIFWNIHEQTPDSIDFSGQNDVREFVRLCAENGMKVILRPGPYVCAEWEMGGLPWWLLKKKDIRLREQDPYFMERVEMFQKALADQLSDLTVDKGGPIIMVQVENEYGSYGTDKPYVSAIRDILRRYYGDDVAMFQCDWSSNFLNNGLDDLVWTINFGTGADIAQQFAPLREARPDSPLMCSEFWSGWFDKWGAAHETRPAEDMIRGIDEMLAADISFSLYMTHGGTNWGHWAGANSPGFAPDVTSYDYDAPINEAGHPTPKYRDLREVLEKYNGGAPLPDLPAIPPTMTIDRFSMTEVAPLFANLPEAVKDTAIRTMEEYDQGFGSIMYRTVLPAMSGETSLTVNDPHDYAQIFVDGRSVGTLDRREGEKTLRLPPCPEGATLDILVEAMGRINFGRAIKDFKGITDNVIISGISDDKEFTIEPKEWEVYCLPDTKTFYDSMEYFPIGAFPEGDADRLARGVYRGTFNIEETADTFLNFESWGKGLVYVNGHAIGRIWEIGPQQTLYMPGCWLKKGENEIMIFDIIGPKEAAVEGLDRPVIDRLNLPVTAREYASIDLSESTPVLSGTFASPSGWQRRMLPSPASGRYFVLEAGSSLDGGETAAIAEIYLLDGEGKRIPREEWKAVYADSESPDGNHTADKAFDLQESTFWGTTGSDFPHTIAVDMGAGFTITGIEYLPRMENGAAGSIKDFNLYIEDTVLEQD